MLSISFRPILAYNGVTKPSHTLDSFGVRTGTLIINRLRFLCCAYSLIRSPYETLSVPPISKTLLVSQSISIASYKYCSKSMIEMGCAGTSTQRGVIRKGNLSVIARISSKDKLPEPITIETPKLNCWHAR